MGAVQRHNFEIVRKGYEPEAVDEVILQLTIAKNDAEALAAKLQKQFDSGGPTPGAASTEAARVVADAKTQARQIIDEAHRQAEATLGGARAEAHRVLAEARDTALGTKNGSPPPASIQRLLALAERFETQITALAKGALADTSSLTRELQQALAAAAQPSGAEHTDATTAPRHRPASRPGIPVDEGESTLDLLRKRSADNKQATKAPTGTSRPVADDERIPEHVQPGGTSLASRVARERGSTATDEDQEHNERGSYYSKRSARLPRIGEDATAGAMAAVRSVRKGGEGAAIDVNDPAAQTA